MLSTYASCYKCVPLVSVPILITMKNYSTHIHYKYCITYLLHSILHACVAIYMHVHAWFGAPHVFVFALCVSYACDMCVTYSYHLSCW